jgi:hypothetical protein
MTFALITLERRLAVRLRGLQSVPCGSARRVNQYRRQIFAADILLPQFQRGSRDGRSSAQNLAMEGRPSFLMGRYQDRCGVQGKLSAEQQLNSGDCGGHNHQAHPPCEQLALRSLPLVGEHVPHTPITARWLIF